MDQFEGISGLTAQHVELLEAAGYLESSSLRNSTIDELHEEISNANDMLSILKTTPSRKEVAGWWNQAEQDVDVFAPLGQESKEVSKPEKSDAISAENVVLAIPISENFIEEKEIDLSKLPRAGENLDVEVTPVKESVKQKVEPRAALYKLPEAEEEMKAPAEFRKEHVLSMDEFREKGGKVAPLARSEENDLTKTTRADTNKGVDPESRRYIRGVLHKEPKRMTFAAFSMIMSALLAVAGVVLTPLIFFDKELFFWAVFAPGLIFVALIVWFLFARSSTCPVCRQRQFMPKACLKHVKAHKITGLGYMLSTAIHILIFRWFRCIFCGTSIRLKE